MSFLCSKRESINFLFSVLCVSRRLDQVICLSVVGTVMGSNIVSVRRSSIKVLWCCLYVILSWETNIDMIVSEHEKRRRICFKTVTNLFANARKQNDEGKENLQRKKIKLQETIRFVRDGGCRFS